MTIVIVCPLISYGPLLVWGDTHRKNVHGAKRLTVTGKEMKMGMKNWGKMTRVEVLG